jgi:hypothetical protein
MQLHLKLIEVQEGAWGPPMPPGARRPCAAASGARRCERRPRARRGASCRRGPSLVARAAQGVLLPGLGMFVVGHDLSDRYAAFKRFRPAFGLLDGRFGGVSQERGKYRLLGERRGGQRRQATRSAVACRGPRRPRRGPRAARKRARRPRGRRPAGPPPPRRRARAAARAADRTPVVQLHYQGLAQAAGAQRAVAQRVVAEMLQRVAERIVAGDPVKARGAGALDPFPCARAPAAPARLGGGRAGAAKGPRR